MTKAAGIDGLDFVAGMVALGAAGPAPVAPAAAAARDSVREKSITTATIDGLEFGTGRA